MPTVARFNITPVKSTALLHPARIDLDARGAQGDHLFMFVEPDGSRLSGRAKAPLLAIRSEHDERAGRLSLSMPDGTHVTENDSPSRGRLRVALYDREIDVRLLGGTFAEAISSYLGRQVELARAEGDERTRSSHAVSIVSLASVDELGRRANGRGSPDPRRFRMLLELDGCEPHEEDGWSGRRLQAGDAIVRVGVPMPRCVITTLDPDSGRPDFPTLDVLATYRRQEGGLMFGVYGDVERAGTVRVGDAATPLDD